MRVMPGLVPGIHVFILVTSEFTNTLVGCRVFL
jgi:hypothetical protein